MNHLDQHPYFVHRMRVAFYETDAMGVVHHANHVRFFENARVEFMRAHGLLDLHLPTGPFVFAVHDMKIHYARTLKWDDVIDIRVQARLHGARIEFQYAIWNPRENAIAVHGWTALVPVDKDLNPARLPLAAREKLRSLPWSDTWPML